MLVPSSPDPLAADELVDKTVGGAGELGHTTGSADGAGELGHATALNLLPATEDGTEPAVEETTLLVQSHVPPTPTTATTADAKQTFPVKKKPPTLKPVNTARKHPRPKSSLPARPRAATPASPLGSGLPTTSQELHVPAEAVARAGVTEQSPPELPWGGQATTIHPVLQISPSTLPPSVSQPFPTTTSSDASEIPAVAPAATNINQMSSVESEVHGSVSEESQETTTSTIITTTVITTEPTPGKP